jgi:hypothetical protein
MAARRVRRPARRRTAVPQIRTRRRGEGGSALFGGALVSALVWLLLTRLTSVSEVWLGVLSGAPFWFALGAGLPRGLRRLMRRSGYEVIRTRGDR